MAFFSECEIRAEVALKELDIALEAKSGDDAYKYYMEFKDNLAPWMAIAQRKFEKAKIKQINKAMVNSGDILKKVREQLGGRS